MISWNESLIISIHFFIINSEKRFYYKSIYKQLLNGLITNGYSFQTYRGFTEHPEKKVILLRHDVDARKEHSLQFAKIQHENGIKGTYYFRMMPQSFDEGGFGESGRLREGVTLRGREGVTWGLREGVTRRNWSG